MIEVVLIIVGLIISCAGVYYARKQLMLQKQQAGKKADSAPHKKTVKDDRKEEPKPLVIRAENLGQDKIATFSMLIESSAHLLEMDRLTGSWGKTIVKYIDITQYGAMWTGREKFRYLLAGSLTNTFHALNGLCAYYEIADKIFQPKTALDILKYLKTWRLDYGAFSTPVTNFDGSIGSPKTFAKNEQDLFRSQDPQLLRHTSCGILAINRLLLLRNIARKFHTKGDHSIHLWEQIVGDLNTYNLSALRSLASFTDAIKVKGASIWGKLRFTPAYVILAIEEGLRHYRSDLDSHDVHNLESLRMSLIRFILEDALQPGERFLFQNTNKKAYYYFSLLVLQHYLQVEAFIHDHRAHEFCKRMIDAFADVLLVTEGLSFGHSEIPGKEWLNYPDVGITSRFLFVLAAYSTAFGAREAKLEKAFKKGLDFIIANAFDVDCAMFNSLAQGWESILLLWDICDAKVKTDLKRRINSQQLSGKKAPKSFVLSVSSRDFKACQPRDLQKKFVEFLLEDQEVLKYIEDNLVMQSHTKLIDTESLRLILKKYFTRETFCKFLTIREIPFRKNSTLEEMIDTTLMQFEFDEV